MIEESEIKNYKMNIYNQPVEQLFQYINKNNKTVWETNKGWNDVGQHDLILKRDMAYELGDDEFEAISGFAVTTDQNLIKNEETILIGKDLNQIKKSQSYARFAILLVDENQLGEKSQLYRNLRKLEYSRYRIHPEGYMMRVSTTQNKEPVRVSKNALNTGLSFSNIGTLFAKEFHKDRAVLAVKNIFITDQDAPFLELKKIACKMEQLTNALDEVFQKIEMDCQTCGLKEICDEVEELKQLHFSEGKK